MSEYDELARQESVDPQQGVEVSAVSEVLASVQALHDQPVADHVAVFERAHERLRRALDQRHG